jgi:signal peptidase II
VKQLKQYCKIVNKKIFYQGLALAAIITFLDLLSKELIFAYLADKPYQGVYVFPFFNLVTVWNSGVSFGMFKDLAAGQYIFTALALAIAIFLIFWLANEKTPKLSFALSLVIGGAFGNIIDRIINGAVADFLDFHIFGYHWPAFNLADSSVTIGALILIYFEFKKPKTS